MIPSPAGGELNFDSACTSPYVSAPSSPPRFGNYFFSAPTSPTRAATLYRDFTDHFPPSTDTGTGPSSTIPFNWEEKPGTPKSKHNTQYNYKHDDADFAFDFSGQLERPSLSADELFDGGKIKPLKPPPGFTETRNRNDSPKSPKNRLKEALSPRQKMKDFDPFAAALEETRRENSNDQLEGTNQRGGEKTYNSSNSSVRGKGLRPLSPVNSKQSSFVNSNSTSTWYSKWKLKDLLLFRSASEGHKDKYAILKKNQNEDVRNSSFRSTDSGGSMSSRRGKGRVSAHEWHYTVNRAAAEEMRRKTFLQDLLRNRLNVDDFEVEEEPRTDFPCPYCYEDFDIASLCSHLEDEHSGESRITVCPICAVKVARDMLSHITLQHGHLFKLHRRRRLRRVAMPYSQTPSILGRDLRDAHLQLLLGGVGHRSSSATSSNAIIDPLLSSLVLNFPASEAEEISKAVVSCAEDLSTKSVTSQHIWKSSFDPSSSIEEREKRLRQAAGKAAFMQDLFFSTLLSE